MDVGAEADVVGEVPADVVGVFVNDDLIGIPKPAVAEADVKRRDTLKFKPAEPEPARTAAPQMPDVAFAEAAGKVAVLPRMIEMVVNIVLARIMAYPTDRPSRRRVARRDGQPSHCGPEW